METTLSEITYPPWMVNRIKKRLADGKPVKEATLVKYGLKVPEEINEMLKMKEGRPIVTLTYLLNYLDKVDLSEATKKIYKSRLRSVSRSLECGQDFCETLNNISSCVGTLQEEYPHSYRDFLQVLLSCDKLIPSFQLPHKDFYRHVSSIESRKSSMLSDKPPFTWEELETKVQLENCGLYQLCNFPCCSEENELSLDEWIMIQLYLEIPARDDFGDLLLIEGKPNPHLQHTQNFYSYTSGKIYLYTYKTSDTFGKKVFSLSCKLQDEIKKSLGLMEGVTKPNRKYLFMINGYRSRHKKCSLDRPISKILTKFGFGYNNKPCTIRDIRIAKVLSVYKLFYTDYDGNKRRKLSELMMWTEETQDRIINFNRTKK